MNNVLVNGATLLLIIPALFSNFRSKLISTLNRTISKIDKNPAISQEVDVLEQVFKNIKTSNLCEDFFNIQSNFRLVLTNISTTPSRNNHYLSNHLPHSHNMNNIPMPNVNHILTVSVTTVDIVTHQKINSYINNAVSSFISSCFKTRDTFLEDLKNRENISHSS